MIYMNDLSVNSFSSNLFFIMHPLRYLPPFGIGTDICKISRIYQNLASHRAIRFVKRILSLKERRDPKAASLLKFLEHRENKLIPRINEEKQLANAAEFIAGRFAAKEAVIKAYNQRKIYFEDITITYEALLPGSRLNIMDKSPPVAIIDGGAIHKTQYARLSISHDGDYAIATCLASLQEPRYLRPPQYRQRPGPYIFRSIFKKGEKP
ncbi:uncharacterized protein F4822DRAFT_93374 [Hypoxylon trugodes]|uniref:uncharacterized protein n=1 Tax=Hypoxylon trugodes TaxID=326681 RepID=UPI00219484EE|nr:uncharacterized protein F4822DRAFT_93374 [Hypoxylon trugodes]KAI1383123.1 hypothetical protein F4822DRAFT_93374 [Hypoxylon trugodes]